jgi:hypothetical protein
MKSRPSGANASAHGVSRPRATISTLAVAAVVRAGAAVGAVVGAMSTGVADRAGVAGAAVTGTAVAAALAAAALALVVATAATADPALLGGAEAGVTAAGGPHDAMIASAAANHVKRRDMDAT